MTAQPTRDPIAVGIMRRADGSTLIGFDGPDLEQGWLPPSDALELGEHLIATASPFVAEELRRVQLSDGTSVLVDADDPNDDATIRAALEAEE